MNSGISAFGTMTIRGLIDAINGFISGHGEDLRGGRENALDAHVYFEFGHAIPTSFASYRGYYDHLAVGFTDDESKRVTFRVFLERLNGAIGQRFSGWKGGEFAMTPESPVWVANRGDNPGTMIVGITEYGFIKTQQHGDR